MAYCTDADVAAAGGVGSTFPTQIAEATDRIERFCGDFFETRTGITMRTRFGPNGMAPLPKRVQSITSVTYVGSSVALDPTAYVVRSSATAGDVDAIELFYGYDDLVVGAERYMGGYANLARPGQGLLVVGNIGWAQTPPAIRTGCAKLAAFLTLHAAADDGELPARVQTVSVEGYSIALDVNAQTLSTGSPVVDRIVWPYRRTTFQVG